MISSMTGFGRTSIEVASREKIAVEIASVNRKQLELRFNMPNEFAGYEADLRKIISAGISRGAISVRVIVAPGLKADNYQINHELLLKLTEEMVGLQKNFGLEAASVNLGGIFNVPGVISNSENASADDGIKNQLIAALRDALDNFVAMRRREGEILVADLKIRLDLLKNLAAAIKPYAAQATANIKAKLLERLKSEHLVPDLNDERLLKEILFYADKSDITEELTRLQSHFQQFDYYLSPQQSEVGRSLDFLIQEMFREITTLANKCASSDISPLTVKFKSELEKIREQIQNLE